MLAAAPTTTRPSTSANNHATGANAVIRASRTPQRQPARHRGPGSGSANPRAACANHGSSTVTTTRPRRPSPQAPETTGTSEYAVAPIRSSHRGAPSGLTRRPATRRNRQEPHRARGTARSSNEETVTVVPRSVPSRARGSRYAGAGTSVPAPNRCHDSKCSPHQSPTASGTGESPVPVIAPYAGRAKTSAATTKTASSTATGLVRNLAATPVSSKSASESGSSRSLASAAIRRAAIDDGSSSAAAARRRSATSAAWSVRAEARSPTTSRPWR